MSKHSRDSLARRKATRQPYPTFLIVCEGDVTEREYFIDLRHLARVPITLRFRSGGVPRTLVQIAVEEKRRPNDYDQIRVVFDVDEHPDRMHGVSRLCRAHMPGYVKKLPCEKLMSHIGAACTRAEQLRTRHARNGTEGHNPSTDVDKLVKTIMDAGSHSSAAGSARYPHTPATP